MKSVFVTGATGILGSNVCEQLRAKGDHVRAIVRDVGRDDAKALRAIGVEVVPGDLTDRAAIRSATEGMDGVIHCGAALGRAGVTLQACLDANVLGSIYVLTAAAEVGGIPVVSVLTTTFFDNYTGPLTEFSALDGRMRHTDVYSLTKRLAYVEGLARTGDGQDVRFMIPGAIYGPSICLEKTGAWNSFNGRIATAIKGEMGPQLPLVVPYVTAGDCAYVCVAALEKGKSGQRYIAHGLPEEAMTLGAYANRACEMAGVSHRIKEIAKKDLDDPELVKVFGPTMPSLAKAGTPAPLFDSSFTSRELGYVPTSIEQGFPVTIDWLKANKFL